MLDRAYGGSGGMGFGNSIDSILGNDILDADGCDGSKCEEIENLIPEYGWVAVQEALLNVLLDDKRRISDYEVAAQVFWGASLDGRDICINNVIALLCHRLPNEEGCSENNLAWSIVTKLKNVGYLSDYCPLQDEEVIQARILLGIV